MSCKHDCSICAPLSWNNDYPTPVPAFSKVTELANLPVKCLGRELDAIMQIDDFNSPMGRKFKGFYKKFK